MGWTLQIVPKGLLLSKFLKNDLIINSNNIQNIERNSLLTDEFQTFNQVDNTVNINFVLNLFNDSPENTSTKPDILGINYVVLSNDPQFQEVVVLLPENFSQNYSYQTNYILDLSAYSFSSTSVPLIQNVIFSTTSGSGIVNIKNWKLSGSSGIKKVYLKVAVLLSDGSEALYPYGYKAFDEITVLSHYVTSPSIPNLIGRTKNNYSSVPVYLQSSVTSDSGLVNTDDRGIASYYWDALILDTTEDLYRNNYYSPSAMVLFKSSQALGGTNGDGLPLIFNFNASVGLGSTGAYGSYTSQKDYILTDDLNIGFFEAFIKVKQLTFNYSSTPVLFYEVNVIDDPSITSNVKILRQQIAINLNLNIITIYTSIDDGNWASDISYIPSVIYSTKTITSPDLIAQMVQSGSFILLLQCIDSEKGVFYSKLLFKSDNFENIYILNEVLFETTAISLNSTVLYFEFRAYALNAVASIIVESTQYGICKGMISGAVNPNDKLLTNFNFPVENNLDSLYDSEEINSWYVISNSPSSGIVNEFSDSIVLFNNIINDSQNNYSAIEVQSSIPTFSEDSTFTVTFSAAEELSSTNTELKTAYSIDSDLDYSDFVFNDLLKTSSGLFLPQNTAKFDYSAVLSWSGSNQFDLYVHDIGAAQTCSLSTTKTNNLFFYSKTNYLGTLQPPTVIKTIENISTSSTFNAWFSTNSYSTAAIITQSLIVKNQGMTPITISSTLGLGTISPGQPLIISNISTSSLSPTRLAINTPYTTINSSINFLYDFGQNGNINEIGIKIQIVDPPECPALLPSFKYSIELSNDFITWVYLEDTEVTETFDPNSGNLSLIFSTPNNSTDINEYRFARLRLYYDAAVTFDPRQIWNYSALSGEQETTDESFINSGKLVFGFTDINVKNIDLGQLYNQPTYLRQFISNSSTVAALVFDFSDYDNSINGPVYLSLMTELGEKKFKTIENNFDLDTDYTASLIIERKTYKDGFVLKPTFALTGGDLVAINYILDDILTDSSSTEGVVFGYYPFISLVGNGKFTISAAIIKGTYNHALSYSNDKTYFSLISSENSNYSAVYGRVGLTQNTYSPNYCNYPNVNSYFASNSVKKFDYSNVSFTVKAATTSSLGLYGTIDVDGVYLTVCDYVLAAGQQDKNENGIYQVQNKQWVKQSIDAQPTILVSEGNVFSDTLWMKDVVSGDWISNIVICPFVLDDNQLLFTGISSIYKYPQFIKLGIGVSNISDVNSLNKIKIKLANSPNVKLNSTDIITQWNSVFQNDNLYSLTSKDVSNNSVYLNFLISNQQLISISTSSFPAIYNLIVSFSGNYQPLISYGSDFELPKYGEDYRAFINPRLIYQMYSTYGQISSENLNNTLLNSSVYGLTVAGQKTLQSGYSTDIILDTSGPSVGILSKITSYTKSALIGLSTVYDTNSGLSIARIVQKTPSNDTIYGSWFGFTTSSFFGVSSIYVYPSYVTNVVGLTTGEPLSGYYRYSLQVADNAGNVTQTNEVENFYYETALIDTQGPQGVVNFIDTDSVPISITSSSLVTAKLLALDTLSGVKAFRYRILPESEFTNWIDYSEFAKIVLPDTLDDGVLSLQFQFKDFGNNVLYSNTTLINEKTYVYTWNIVSRLITNVLFTVTESATFDDRDVLIIGASKSSSATLYLWDNSQLLELEYAGFGEAKVISAIKKVDDTVVIGTDVGQILLYQNGIISGPYEIFNWGDQALPISSFEIHKYPDESEEYLYATTLIVPRIFRTPVSNLRNLSWEIVQPRPICLQRIDVLNTGLWSGNSIYYSISSSFVPASLSLNLNYGISSVIVSNKGYNYVVEPTISFSGPITGASISPVMQGYLGSLNLFNNGTGYTSGASVTISSPSSGGSSIQATGYAVTNTSGQIISVGISSAGYGYTSTPTVLITGIGNYGRDAVVTASVILDSIHSISVVSAGIATTTNITLSVTGVGTAASLSPAFLYRVESVDIVNPGYGYTSTPTIFINGISTIASATISNGSIQSVAVVGSTYTFLASQASTVSIVGGAATNWTGSISTSSVIFTSSGIYYYGTVISSISVTTGGQGLSTAPFISFSSSIYDPKLEYVYSDDLILNTQNESIYNIKSFDDKLFFSSSSKDLIKLSLQNDNFELDRIKLNLTSNEFDSLTPEILELAEVDDVESLYFSVKEEPFIGKLSKENKNIIFDAYQNNILSFKPYNFDILSDWQLVKILNLNGIGTVAYSDNNRDRLLISAENGLIYYQSSKNNTWYNRCQGKDSYLITFIFRATSGTQSAEIYNTHYGLQVAFTVLEESLQISYGLNTYETVDIDIDDVYSITFIKNSLDLYIYSDAQLIKQEVNFYTSSTYTPMIKFGHLFEPQELTINGTTQSLFTPPTSENSSSFVWHQIKFSFDTREFDENVIYYEMSLPYTMPNSASVRVLKSLNGTLYAATKSIYDSRTISSAVDVGSKVFKLENDYWTDVTGSFELYAQGINTSYILTSPIDINNLGDSYFITGLIKSIPARILNTASILLGLSSSIVYEEETFYLTIVYPYNPNPGGKLLFLSNTSNLLQLPTSVLFQAQDVVKSIQVGVGSTTLNTDVTITASDGSVTANTTITVLPTGISTIGINTNSFVGYSLDPVIANVTFYGRTLSNRNFYIKTNKSTLLTVPNGGLSTLFVGSISTSIIMSVGIATTTSSLISITASYRNSISTAFVTIKPFILSTGLNTSSFVGNQLYGNVIYTASVQSPPLADLRVNISSGLSTILTAPPFISILTGAISTSINLTIGGPVTSVQTFNIQGVSTGSISTSTISAYYYYIATATSTNYRPILGIQTSEITLTLNTTPTNGVLVYNVVQNPTGVGMTYVLRSPVLAGTISTTFSISTTIEYAAGLGVTIQGAPLGYNTTPSPGIILVSDIWRITELIVTPSSIVGAGANSQGIAQSYIIFARVNHSAVGLATTVLISSTHGFIGLSSTLMRFHGSATSTGYATGFTTSFASNVTFTALGPNWSSITVANLVLNPFMISSFSTQAIWSGGYNPNYTVSGVGATFVATFTLNAYAYLAVQYINVTTINPYIFMYGQVSYPSLSTVNIGSNSATLNFGISTAPLGFTTSLTANVMGSTGIATTTVLSQTFSGYYMEFESPAQGYIPKITAYFNAPLPVSVGVSAQISNGQNTIINIPGSSIGISSSFVYTSLSIDSTLVAVTSLLGSVQTYYITGYAKTGTVTGMGYNYYGELSSSYPVTGLVGSPIKVKIYNSVTKVASGNHHSLILTNQGDVFAIGDNTYNQIGFNNALGLSTALFRRVLFNKKAKDVFAQNNTSYVLLSDNTLYAFGSNNLSAFGTSAFTGISTYVPVIVSRNVKLCSVYNDRGVIVTYSNTTGINTIYEFGQGSILVGKGITQLNYLDSPRTVSIQSISHIDCGPKHTIAAGTWIDVSLGISSYGAFSWGDNLYYQTGTAATTGSVITPNVLHYFNPSGIPKPIILPSIVVADYNSSVVVGLSSVVTNPVINTIYLIGSASSFNNTGTGIGISQTSIATVLTETPFSGISTLNLVYKVAKNLNHFVWVTGLGSVYVSGGYSQLKLTQNTYRTPSDYDHRLLMSPINYFYDGSISSTLIGVYENDTVQLTTVSLNYPSANLCNKFVIQPRQYYNSTLIYADDSSVGLGTTTGMYTTIGTNNCSVGGFSIAKKQSEVNIFYNLKSVNNPYRDYLFTAGDDMNDLIDVTIGWDLSSPSFSTVYTQIANIFGVKYNYNGVTTSVYIKQFTGITSSENAGETLIGPISYNYVRLSAPTSIDATYIRNFRGSSVVIGSTTYEWYNSSYNVVVGYSDGLLELYGNAYSYGLGLATSGSSFSASLITSWYVDAKVTCMKSIIENIGSNRIYLIIATSSGKVYSYNGKGAGSYSVINSQTSSAPSFIYSRSLNSNYGYITQINSYTSGSFIAITSNSYLLIINNSDLSVVGVILVPLKPNSLHYNLARSLPAEATIDSLYQIIVTGVSTNYQYSINNTHNYEIGLDYKNPSGSFKLMTKTGVNSGVGVTNVINASTADTFTMIIDSS